MLQERARGGRGQGEDRCRRLARRGRRPRCVAARGRHARGCEHADAEQAAHARRPTRI